MLDVIVRKAVIWPLFGTPVYVYANVLNSCSWLTSTGHTNVSKTSFRFSFCNLSARVLNTATSVPFFVKYLYNERSGI